MPKICIVNLNNQQLVTNNNSKSVLDIIHENHIDWMHSCGKKGRCTTCKMIVVEGKSHLSPKTKFEQQYADMNWLAADERLACQCSIHGDIVIKVPEAFKLPHMRYSD